MRTRQTAARRSVIAIGAISALISTGNTAAPPDKAIELTPLGVYKTLLFDQAGTEIVAYDAATFRVFSTNLALKKIDIIDISNPSNPWLAGAIELSSYGGQANSVAVHGGIVAVPLQAAVKTDPGKVLFFDAFGNYLNQVNAGALPDMATFSPDGRYVLVANEGEPNDAYTIDPPGSITIVDLKNGVAGIQADDVAQLDFSAFNGATLDPSVRIFGPGANVARDLEPEYVAVSHDSQTAWVSLQENNAVAIVDLKSKRITRIVGLGFKNHALQRNALDASDQDSANSIRTWPVFGMFQPDALATFTLHGRTYIATANEGDVRDYAGFAEARRVSTLNLDTAAFPDQTIKMGSKLGRLNVTTAKGDLDGDGDYDELYAFGARSFSILTDTGEQVFDSGDDLEQKTAAVHPGNFNASNTNNTRDNRSDDKGPEPEGITAAKLFGRTFVFVALERIGGIMVYEVIDPSKPLFVQYINVRNFAVAPNPVDAGDLGPEGMVVVSEDASPTGKPLLLLASEVSGTVRVFEINQSK